MTVSSQEKEFAVFGFINRKMRSGLIITIISISLLANIYLVKMIIDKQDELYQKMLDRVDKSVDQKVNDKLDEPVQQMQESVRKVNTSVSRVDSIANNTSDLNGQLEQQLKSKK